MSLVALFRQGKNPALFQVLSLTAPRRQLGASGIWSLFAKWRVLKNPLVM